MTHPSEHPMNVEKIAMSHEWRKEYGNMGDTITRCMKCGLHRGTSAADYPCRVERRADGTTHWEDCWRSHIACAVKRIESLAADKERLTIDLSVARNAALDHGVSLDVLPLASKVVIERHRANLAERRADLAEKANGELKADAEKWRCLCDTPCTITFDETVTFKTPNGGQVIHVKMIGNTELDAAIAHSGETNG